MKKCGELSNIYRKASCEEQVTTRQAAKSGNDKICDVLSSTGSRESCRTNMLYWKAVEHIITP